MQQCVLVLSLIFPRYLRKVCPQDYIKCCKYQCKQYNDLRALIVGYQENCQIDMRQCKIRNTHANTKMRIISISGGYPAHKYKDKQKYQYKKSTNTKWARMTQQFYFAKHGILLPTARAPDRDIKWRWREEDRWLNCRFEQIQTIGNTEMQHVFLKNCSTLYLNNYKLKKVQD